MASIGGNPLNDADIASSAIVKKFFDLFVD